MKIDHVAINVEDPVAVGKWYAEQFNLQRDEVQDHPAKPQMLYAAGGGGTLEIYGHPRGDVPDYPNMKTRTLHLAFAVDDVAATAQKLVTAGATLIEGTETEPNGNTLAMLRDPWGIPIQLISYAK